MELKPGYKQTEVGVLPEDWNVNPLSVFADVKTGPFGSALHERDYVNDGTPIITVEHLSEQGVVHENLPLVSDSDRNRLSSYSLRAGDIVFSRVGSVDRNALIRDSESGWLFSGRLLRVRVLRCDVHPPYLSFHFHSEAFKQRVRTVAVGQTMASLNTQILKGIYAVLPTEEEQRAIATALSDVDALLDGLDRLIAKKRDIKQAAMQQLLTGETRLPGFEGEWEVKRLGEIAHIKTGSRNNEDKIEDGEYPFFVRSEFIERINSYSHDCEAILVPGEGRIGDIFHYINGRFDVHQRVYAITQFKPGVSTKFVHLYMAMKFGAWAMQNTVKATVDSLRLPTFQTFELLVPPTRDEQTAIATILSDMDAEIAALEQRRNKTKNIKQAMMQELLTGKTRLVAPGGSNV